MAEMTEERWEQERERLAQEAIEAVRKLLKHTKSAALKKELSADRTMWLFAGELEAVRKMADDELGGRG